MELYQWWLDPVSVLAMIAIVGVGIIAVAAILYDSIECEKQMKRIMHEQPELDSPINRLILHRELRRYGLAKVLRLWDKA